MPRLVVLNGPPGIGKSTLARRWVEDHPLALSLEQDLVRGLLGGWRTREDESGALARELCVVMARAHLAAGHDVIVPQFVALPTYLDRLASLAREASASYVELVLLDDVEGAKRRFHARAGDPLLAEHQHTAAALIEQAGGYGHEYARLMQCLEGRQVLTIDSRVGDSDAAYLALEGAVSRAASEEQRRP